MYTLLSNTGLSQKAFNVLHTIDVLLQKQSIKVYNNTEVSRNNVLRHTKISNAFGRSTIQYSTVQHGM